MPLAHKDMYYIEGKPAGCGSKVREGWIAPATSTAIARLDEAGAIRIGALHMAEFAYGPTGHNAYLGPARNPWNPQHITGGSSSGSGAAVAARLTYGSARLRYRRLDPHAGALLRRDGTEDHVPAASAAPMPCRYPSRSTPSGHLARTAEDCGLIAQAIAGEDPLDPVTDRSPTWDIDDVASVRRRD